MAEDNEFVHESVQDTATIQGLLRALQEAVAEQRIVLSAEGREMILTPASMLHLSITGRKKGAGNKLKIEISWEDASVFETEQEKHISIQSSTGE
ncbi:amphi-Trp domain-containing protein [Desulfovermiculus halophilus]|jgi:amphi-Trp domain-containing protein|uniref:amphi-Trp domain-containing protein n=1 Tax=Desulfovermiculus halophilus TaxID=339722 RepID=UPI000480E236|nr:amphi-Trp domain-containing protein [Desulfovermiculus halophilus]